MQFELPRSLTSLGYPFAFTLAGGWPVLKLAPLTAMVADARVASKAAIDGSHSPIYVMTPQGWISVYMDKYRFNFHYPLSDGRAILHLISTVLDQ